VSRITAAACLCSLLQRPTLIMPFMNVTTSSGADLQAGLAGGAHSALVEAAWSVVEQPGPLHAFDERIRVRRGHGIAAVAGARKLAVLFWCPLTRGEDYAHQQPSLTAKKLRLLEIRAGAPTLKGKHTGTWATRQQMRKAERELAQGRRPPTSGRSQTGRQRRRRRARA
jgi:transposase